MTTEREKLRKEAEAAANRRVQEQQQVIDALQQKLGEKGKDESLLLSPTFTMGKRNVWEHE